MNISLSLNLGIERSGSDAQIFETIIQLVHLIRNSTEKPVREWSRNPAPCVQEFALESIIIYVFISSVCSIITSWSCYKFRNEIKVWMFSHKILRWMVTKKETDCDKKYDAFVCYSHLDEWFVIDELMPQLEGGPNPYKLCIHQRDWQAGALIATQIHESVRNSKRTIIVLSSNYLKSVWAKLEFHVAYMLSIKEGYPRIIIIVLGDIVDDVEWDEELKIYLRTYTYIQWNDPRFWSKLKHALPHEPLGGKRGLETSPSELRTKPRTKIDLI